MEACGGSQHWARRLRELGHEPSLLPAKAVRPFVAGNKNDAHDAQAIWTAAQMPGVRTVAVKSEEQQAILALHRSRRRPMWPARAAPAAAASSASCCRRASRRPPVRGRRDRRRFRGAACRPAIRPPPPRRGSPVRLRRPPLPCPVPDPLPADRGPHPAPGR